MKTDIALELLSKRIANHQENVEQILQVYLDLAADIAKHRADQQATLKVAINGGQGTGVEHARDSRRVNIRHVTL